MTLFQIIYLCSNSRIHTRLLINASSSNHPLGKLVILLKATVTGPTSLALSCLGHDGHLPEISPSFQRLYNRQDYVSAAPAVPKLNSTPTERFHCRIDHCPTLVVPTMFKIFENRLLTIPALFCSCRQFLRFRSHRAISQSRIYAALLEEAESTSSTGFHDLGGNVMAAITHSSIVPAVAGRKQQ